MQTGSGLEKLPGGILVTTVEKLANWARKGSLWPATFGLACCAIEMMAAGAGRYRATKVGAEAYAVQLAEDARRFTLTRSELRSGIDTILTYVTFAIVPTAALLFFSQIRAVPGDWREAVSGAVAAWARSRRRDVSTGAC